MKPGSRALGVAVSDGDRRATVGGAVVRQDRATDGFAFTDCTVGGTDATAAVCDLVSVLDREDLRLLTLAGIAPAWFNVIDIHAVHEAADRPVIAVSFESSPGLADALSREFDDEAARRRLELYRRLPERHRRLVGGRPLWLRTVGISPDRAATVLEAYTPNGQGRPEPLRVAKQAASATRAYRERRGPD